MDNHLLQIVFLNEYFFWKKQYPRPCRKEKIEPKYLYILSVVTITHIHTNTTKAFCLLRCKQNISRKKQTNKDGNINCQLPNFTHPIAS